MTAPDRNAAGLARAIQKACAMAHLQPADISFIAAHGTATVFSDAMELLAFQNAFTNQLPVFSIKGAVGHTLAAAGLLQILVAAHALNTKTVPPNVGVVNADVAGTMRISNQPIRLADCKTALSTNSGFGGVNTAIVLGTKGAP